MNWAPEDRGPRSIQFVMEGAWRMKIYTVRFRCKARLEHKEPIKVSDYELQLEAENLEAVYTRLDDYLENWEEGASIPLNAPGGEIAIETLEILNSEGEVLY